MLFGDCVEPVVTLIYVTEMLNARNFLTTEKKKTKLKVVKNLLPLALVSLKIALVLLPSLKVMVIQC